MRDFLLGSSTRCVPFGNGALLAFQAQREFPERMLRIVALVDVGGDFAPAVQHLHGVIAAFDLRQLDQRAARLVDRDPGFAIDDVEIGIGPGHAAGLAMDDFVPLEAVLEIERFLPEHQPAAEHVLVGLDDVPVRQTGNLRCRRCGTSNAACEKQRGTCPRVAVIAAPRGGRYANGAGLAHGPDGPRSRG